MAKTYKKSLREVYLKYRIDIRDKRGFLKNPLDILEEIYLKMDVDDFKELQDEIFFQEKLHSIFDREREAGTMTTNF